MHNYANYVSHYRNCVCLPKNDDLSDHNCSFLEKVDATVIDGCTLLWTVHWPEKGTVKDYADNFLGYIMAKAAQMFTSPLTDTMTTP